MPARYTAHARIMLNIVKPDPVSGQALTSQFARAYVKTQTELITDYRIAGKVVDMLNWASSPEFADQYDNRRNDDVRDFRRFLAQIIINSTGAELIEGSNILDISYTAPNPQGAADVAEALRRAYVEQAIALKREDATKDAEWFTIQTGKLKTRLTEAESRKSEFERAHGIILDDDRVDQESRKLQALAGAAPAPSAPTMVMGASNPNAAQIAQFDAAIATAERTLGANNPQLMDLRRQRASLASASSGAGAVVTGGGGPSIGAMYGSQVQKVLAQRGKVAEARQLATEVALLREQYEKAALRVGELEQMAQSTDSGLTPLGAATAPESPSFPKWPLIVFGSLGLGLLIGVFVAMFVELLARRVRGLEDLRFSGIPVLGVMTTPHPTKNALGWFGRRSQVGATA